MWASILTIAAAFSQPAALWLSARIKARGEPRNIIERQLRENREAIARGHAGALLEYRINRLRPN